MLPVQEVQSSVSTQSSDFVMACISSMTYSDASVLFATIYECKIAIKNYSYSRQIKQLTDETYTMT